MSPEQTEALARAIFDLERVTGPTWDDTSESLRQSYRDSIARALEATRPELEPPAVGEIRTDGTAGALWEALGKMSESLPVVDYAGRHLVALEVTDITQNRRRLRLRFAARRPHELEEVTR